MSDVPSSAAGGLGSDRFVLLLGRCSVIFAAIVSGWMGWTYWIERGEVFTALFVIVFELAGVAALHFVIQHWSAGRHWRAAFALVVLACCVGFCGYTNWRKFDERAASERAAILEQAPDYIRARASLDSTLAALRQHLDAVPPSCACPATIEAWTLSHERRLAALNAQRIEDQRRLDELIPPPQVNILSLFAIAIEFLKIVGFTIFAGNVSPRRASVSPTKKRLRAWWLGWLSLGANATSLGAQATAAPSEAQATASRLTSEARTEQHADPQALKKVKIAQARAWALEGVPKTEIARRLGVHRNTVHNWLRL